MQSSWTNVSSDLWRGDGRHWVPRLKKQNNFHESGIIRSNRELPDWRGSVHWGKRCLSRNDCHPQLARNLELGRTLKLTKIKFLSTLVEMGKVLCWKLSYPKRIFKGWICLTDLSLKTDLYPWHTWLIINSPLRGVFMSNLGLCSETPEQILDFKSNAKLCPWLDSCKPRCSKMWQCPFLFGYLVELSFSSLVRGLQPMIGYLGAEVILKEYKKSKSFLSHARSRLLCARQKQHEVFFHSLLCH